VTTNLPGEHADPWLNLLHGYTTEAVRALESRGITVDRSWLDPRDPRDATIVFGAKALVWDEECGWQVGGFESGEQGSRTRLSDPAHLGGGVLLEPEALAHRLATGATAPRQKYRSYDDVRDGLDDTLRQLYRITPATAG
jgi:Family of unknown function (DUF6292)